MAAQCVCAQLEPFFNSPQITFLAERRRFEPKISLAATFLGKRLLSCAILGRLAASFIHFLIGSIQPVRFCSKLIIFSSSDFFSLINLAFLSRYRHHTPKSDLQLNPSRE